MKKAHDSNFEMKNKGTARKWVRCTAMLLVAVLAVVWVFPSVVKIVNGTAEENDPIARIYSMLTGTLENPETAEEYYELANIAIGQNSYFAALDYLATARTLVDAEDNVLMGEMWLKSATIYILQGDMENAKVCLNSALNVDPESVQAILLQAQLLIEEQDYLGAADELRKYVALAPDDVSTWQTLAQLYESMGEYELARAEYAAMYELYGDDDAYLLNALRCGLLSGNYEETLADFEAYLNDNPEAETEYRSVAMFLKAVCQMQMGSYADAAETFHRAIDEGYDAVTCYEQIIACDFESADYQALVLAGEEMLAAELTPSAEDSFYQKMGVALMQLERSEEAVEYLGKSMEINPELQGNHYYRGVCYLALDMMDEAIADFTASIEEDFMVQYCYYNRGVCYVQLVDYDSALDDFEMTLTSGDNQSLIDGAKDILWQLVEYYENQTTTEQSDIPYDEAV